MFLLSCSILRFHIDDHVTEVRALVTALTTSSQVRKIKILLSGLI